MLTLLQLSDWSANAFSLDPFASQGSTSDPFSGDPFGEDPFNRQANNNAGAGDNPFSQPAAAAATNSAKDIKVPEALPKVCLASCTLYSTRSSP